MQFFAVAALFGAALAAPAAQTPECPNPAHCGPPPNPANYENIDITDYTLRKNNGTIQSVYFKLSGENATDLVCETGALPALPAPVVTCGESDYRFGIVPPTNGTTDFGIAIYHQTGLASGKWGMGNVPSYCRAGGNGPLDFVCQQTNAFTLVITNGLI